jgi:hypothetical protein
MSDVTGSTNPDAAIQKLVRYRDEVRKLTTTRALMFLAAIAFFGISLVLMRDPRDTAFWQSACFVSVFFVVGLLLEFLLAIRKFVKFKRIVKTAEAAEFRPVKLLSSAALGYCEIADVHLKSDQITGESVSDSQSGGGQLNGGQSTSGELNYGHSRRLTILKFDPSFERDTQVELAELSREKFDSFPLDCVALFDKKTNQPKLLYVKDVLLNANVITDSDGTVVFRRRQSQFRVKSILSGTLKPIRLDELSAEEKKEYVERVVEKLLKVHYRTKGLVDIGYAFLALIPIGLFVACWGLRETHPLLFWLINMPLGLIIVASLAIPVFNILGLRATEEQMKRVRSSTPIEIAITKIESHPGDNQFFWIEFQQGKLADVRTKRIRTEAAALEIQDFWLELVAGFKTLGGKPDGPFPLPAILFIEPSKHDPVAVVVADMLTCVAADTLGSV